MVKQGLELETRHENGDITTTPVKSELLFHGKETSDPDSLVAVSNDKGLVRCLVDVISAMRRVPAFKQISTGLQVVRTV